MKIPLEADFPVEKQPRPDAASLKSKVVTKKPTNATGMQKKPVVTVITAVFKAIESGRKEQFLQSMDSVQAQTGTVIEHLIIDGASTDGTVELIQNYQNANVPIRLLSEPDSGIYDAMNKGLWLARGKYVIFLNSDDFYTDPNGLADSVRRLEETGADFSYAPIRVVDETTGEPVKHPNCAPNVNLILGLMAFSHQSMMVRRQAMIDIHGFDLRYPCAADYDSLMRLIFKGCRACFVPTVFVTFRLGGFSIVHEDQSQHEVGVSFSRLFKQYLDMDFTPEEGRQFYLTLKGPKELRQRQFRFVKATFGDAIQLMSGELKNDIPNDLRIMQYQLQTIHKYPGSWKSLKSLTRLLFTSPGLFSCYLLYYFYLRCRRDSVDAGKQAFQKLFCREQKKRNMQSAADQPSVPLLRHPTITHQDYWCTYGILANEPWGAWTEKTFSVFCQLPEDYHGRDLMVEVQLGGFVFPESPRRFVDVVVNHQQVARITLENLMPLPYRFTIPADVATAKILDIDFTVDQTFSPKELGFGGDPRMLGMTFQKLVITKAGRPKKELQKTSK